jgi:hypothetical protein
MVLAEDIMGKPKYTVRVKVPKFVVTAKDLSELEVTLSTTCTEIFTTIRLYVIIVIQNSKIKS